MKTVDDVWQRPISVYASAYSPVPQESVTLEQIFERIVYGSQGLSAATQQIRTALASGESNRADGLKRQLPGVTYAGVFGRRCKHGLLQSAGLVTLDYDEVGDLEKVGELRDRAARLRHTTMAHVSPSGRGVRVVIAVDPSPDAAEAYRAAWQVTREYYDAKLDAHSDDATSDISRLAFLSFDPEVRFNSDVVPFRILGNGSLAEDQPAEVEIKGAPLISEDFLTGESGDKTSNLSRGSLEAALAKACEAIRAAPKGSRNATLNAHAFHLGQLVATGGLSRHRVEDELEQAALDAGLPAGEIDRTILSGLEAGLRQLAKRDQAWLDDLLERSKTDPGAPFELGAIARLQALPAADWQRWRVRLREAKTGIPLADLDAAIRVQARDLQGKQLHGRGIEWLEARPWSEPVDGAELLSSLSDFVTSYVAMPGELADALGLWIGHSYLHDRLELSTFLNVTSATKRCGKTLLLEIIAELVQRPLAVAGDVTPAALFRTIEIFGPTLLLDEIDTYLANDRELRGLLNGSQRRASAFVIRTVGEDFEPRRFATWCPKVLVGIGGLPDTVLDRSVVVRLERRSPRAAPLHRWRDRDKGVSEQIRRKLVRWVADNAEAILAARAGVEFPPDLQDRARDAWESLLAIATVAGGEWAGQDGRGWAACEALRPTESDETGAREQLLADLRAVFAESGDPESLATQEILAALHKLESRPWSEWGRSNRPLTPRGLSSLLAPFKVRPRNRRSGGKQSKGYRREDLEPIWERYAVPSPKEGSPIRPTVPMPSETTFPQCHHPSRLLEVGQQGNPRKSDQELIGTAGRVEYTPPEAESEEGTLEPTPTPPPATDEPDGTWVEGEL